MAPSDACTDHVAARHGTDCSGLSAFGGYSSKTAFKLSSNAPRFSRQPPGHAKSKRHQPLGFPTRPERTPYTILWRQPFHNGRFANSVRRSIQYVFCAARQNLHHTANPSSSADDRIELEAAREIGEIARVICPSLRRSPRDSVRVTRICVAAHTGKPLAIASCDTPAS